MAAFRFRAEAALAFRREREERARIDLAAAERRVAEADAAMRGVTETLASESRRFAEAETRAGTVEAYVWHRAWLASLEQRRRALQAALAAADLQQRDARAILLRARRDVRVLERLRERAWRLHQAGEAQREQTDMDWLGTLKHTLARRRAKEDT